MTIQEIERPIAELKPHELARVREWFEEFDAQAWDEQFERDAKSGKLDKLVDKTTTKKHLGKLQGSLKDKGGLKTLLDERQKD